MLATIKLASHLENISDQAVVIARRIRTLIQDSALKGNDELTSLFEVVDHSLSEALDAFTAFDSIRPKNFAAKWKRWLKAPVT